LIVLLYFVLEKYDYVGHLLKPGESHSYYSDEEETPTNKLHMENPKQCAKPLNNSDGNSSADKVNNLKSENNDQHGDSSSISGAASNNGSEIPDVVKSSDDTLEK